MRDAGICRRINVCWRPAVTQQELGKMAFSLANRTLGWVRTALMLGVAGFVMATAAPALAQDYPGIIAAPDRSDADRQTDKRRDPVELLTFTGAKTGWSVLDMGAGAGYSTELMARSVGPTGKVYGQTDEES